MFSSLIGNAGTTKQGTVTYKGSSAELNLRTPSHVVRTFGRGNVKAASRQSDADLPKQEVFDLLESSDEASSASDKKFEVN